MRLYIFLERGSVRYLKPDMGYVISEATSAKELADVDRFVEKVFIPSVPDMRTFGVPITETTLRWCAPSKCVSNGNKSRDFVLMASDSFNGNIIGVSIIKEVPYSSDEYFERSLAMEQLDDFLEYAEKAADLPDIPGGTTELAVLSVSDDWRGRGVAKLLAEESEVAAKARGYAAIKMLCTSEFTAKLARRLGWREHFKLRYADYPALSGNEVQLIPCPPHESVYYFIKVF